MRLVASFRGLRVPLLYLYRHPGCLAIWYFCQSELDAWHIQKSVVQRSAERFFWRMGIKKTYKAEPTRVLGSGAFFRVLPLWIPSGISLI